jgi:hypothetical protein
MKKIIDQNDQRNVLGTKPKKKKNYEEEDEEGQPYYR